MEEDEYINMRKGNPLNLEVIVSRLHFFGHFQTNLTLWST